MTQTSTVLNSWSMTAPSPIDLGPGPESVVGTYRMMRRAGAARVGRFYSAAEYDIGRLVAEPGEILEMGRSCIDAGHRTRSAMQVLWRGVTAYVLSNDIAFLFGCASLHGTDRSPGGAERLPRIGDTGSSHGASRHLFRQGQIHVPSAEETASRRVARRPGQTGNETGFPAARDEGSAEA